MLQEEIEHSAFVELLRHAAAVDRLSGGIADRELVRRLAEVRGRLEAALTLLADRYEMPSIKTQQQLRHERQHPWDKL